MTEETFLAYGPYRPIRVVKCGEPPSRNPLLVRRRRPASRFPSIWANLEPYSKKANGKKTGRENVTLLPKSS